MYFNRGNLYGGYQYNRPAATGMEPVMASSNVFNSSTSNGQWTPTILYLFVLVLVEMFVFAVIARHV